jgi:hypothetical protein
MIGGFAFVAHPASYGNSGVMTFIVSHAGAVFQKDLGAHTAQIAEGHGWWLQVARRRRGTAARVCVSFGRNTGFSEPQGLWGNRRRKSLRWLEYVAGILDRAG